MPSFIQYFWVKKRTLKHLSDRTLKFIKVFANISISLEMRILVVSVAFAVWSVTISRQIKLFYA